MNREIRHYEVQDLEIRADEGPAILKGYASVFDRPSHDLGGFREFVAKGAFKRSLEAALTTPDRNIFALWSHRHDQPLGSIQGGKLKLSEDERGLAFELDTSRMTAAQLDAARDGELRMSFGFSVVQEKWERMEGELDQRTLLDVDLFEVSPVIAPAYPDTSAAIRSLNKWKKKDETKSRLMKAFADFKVRTRK